MPMVLIMMEIIVVSAGWPKKVLLAFRSLNQFLKCDVTFPHVFYIQILGSFHLNTSMIPIQNQNCLKFLKHCMCTMFRLEAVEEEFEQKKVTPHLINRVICLHAANQHYHVHISPLHWCSNLVSQKELSGWSDEAGWAGSPITIPVTRVSDV